MTLTAVEAFARAHEADMARHVETYACEWTETVNDPARRALFRTFINAPLEALR